jgi:cell division protein FtsI/penicillin-binding protein 2
VIGDRRTTAPILMIAVGAVALFLRQAHVQLDEHEIWSEEAARLERSGELLPYTRGTIRDATGRVLVRDREAYHLEFAYRDFRRNHPLGVVAHAASVVLLEPVSLVTSLDFAEEWAVAFAELTPGDLYDLRRGAGLRVALAGLPGSLSPDGGAKLLAAVGSDEERSSSDLAGRAGDLGYYIGRLLQLTKDETKALLRAHEEEARVNRSYLQLVADLRRKDLSLDLSAFDGLNEMGASLRAEEILREELRTFVRRSISDLDTLAARMGIEGVLSPRDGDVPAVELVRDLESWRRSIENAAARKLFREAARFTPGRIDADTLLELFELDWIALYMRWDRPRLETWARRTRQSWLSGWRGSYALPRLLAELRHSDEQSATVERACSLFSTMWYREDDLSLALDGNPTELGERVGLAVFEELRDIFIASVGTAPRPADERLPWAAFVVAAADREPIHGRDGFDGKRMVAARGAAPEGSQSWLDVEARLTLASREGKPTTRAKRWEFHLDPGRANYRSLEILSELAGEVCDAWEESFQLLVREALADARRAALAGQLTDGGALRFNEDSLDRASDRARFILRDFGMRRNALLAPEGLEDEWPSYEVVQLLTRYPDRFPGFQVQDARERVAFVRDGELGLPGVALLGSTMLLDPERAQGQRADAKRLEALRQMGKRTPEDDVELYELIGRVETFTEARGASGIEGSFNHFLRGQNGYRERVGLEEGGLEKESNLRNVTHGKDVGLTLSSELQLVAEQVLEYPDIPVPVDAPEKVDAAWLADPEGAIVIMRPNGDLVVAASGPAPWSPRVSLERASIERCLTMVDFKPPGSTFKPFAALWALEKGRITATDTFLCERATPSDGSNKCSYRGVHCHTGYGHSEHGFGVTTPLDLADAIHVSCNVYFAHVGEMLTIEDLQGLADTFGFGEATGIVPEGSRGIVEHTFGDLFTRKLGDKDRMRAANGLSVVQVTPVQMARATAGLATGILPSVRIVDRIGAPGEERPYFGDEAEKLNFSEANLGVIREAMKGVANDPTGSGMHALSREDLGFDVAMKTGSADLTSGDGTVRKHTWVMGWAPADDPKVVFTFFVRDTMATSHNSSTYLARQFLVHPEFRQWLSEEGADIDPDFEPGPPIAD